MPLSFTGIKIINLCTARSVVMYFIVFLLMNFYLGRKLLYETFTLLTKSSFPGKVSEAIPNFHSPRTTLLSCTRTTLPFCTFRLSTCHFGWIAKPRNKSLDHFFRNIYIMLWIWSNLRLSITLSLNSPCGAWVDDLPKIKSFGHKYIPSSGVDGWLPIGRWFTIEPAWNIIFIPLSTVFTNACVAPFTQRLSAGSNCHLILSLTLYLFNRSQSIPLMTSWSSFDAATNDELWSLKILFVQPHSLVNWRRNCNNESVE